jgi:peptidoglycan/xylan/chitin deacetylase (PgdA/CDA1 family)
MGEGKLVISLDFELLWGVRDVVGIQRYRQHIKGVHTVIPQLLKIFTEYNIKATFAIVGFLFFENKTELLNNLPLTVPMYIDKTLSPYTGYFNNIGESFEDDPYHYSPQLIRLIQSYPDQEIGSHTFSHYYCLEAGQTIDDFKNDLKSAKKIADKLNINLRSLIFPRNQFNNKYLKVCEELGITNYRGNESSYIYKAVNGLNGNLIKRALRLLDSYIKLT